MLSFDNLSADKHPPWSKAFEKVSQTPETSFKGHLHAELFNTGTKLSSHTWQYNTGN